MLRQLVQAVARGGSGDLRALAQELGTPLPVVEAMLDELARRGLVQRAADCRPSCGDCPVSGGCGSKDSGGIWVLTRAGREASGG